jgi:tetratricopeptide (TPR) repeat protein/TolB-like protein
MADIIHEIKNRRILPAVGVYAGGCWVLIEILDRLVERYLLSPYITDIAFWGLYSLIPAVILVAWSHGRPGKDKSTTLEKVGVPINIIATLGLLLTAFGGKELGATANMITVANEEGVQETHYVPSESFRRRMAVFFFENASGDPGLDWLQYGITELLVQDLQQNPFVLATSPWNNFGNGFYRRMRQAGFEDGLGVPRSLMREIALDANRQHFLEGSIDRDGQEYRLTVRIWNTQTLQQVDELTESGWDLYDTVDELSVEIRNALDIPHAGDRMGGDLPLADTYGESQAAFRSYINGLNERLFNNDFPASNAYFDAAIATDDGFVLAWFLKAVNQIDAGDLPASQEAIQKAQALDYRLPMRDRVTLKALNYRLSGQQDKLIAFLRMQVRLHDDATSHGRLAGMLMSMGELEEAKERFLTALDRDPMNLGVYLQLSILERATGDPDKAIEYAERYRDERPEDIEAHMVLGDYLRDNGDLEAAEDYYEQATLLENFPVQPLLRLADLAARRGDEQAARAYLEQAEAAAQTPLDKGLVRQSAAYLEYWTGRLHASIEQLYAQEEFLRQSTPPFQVALATYVPMVNCYVHLGDVANAEAALETARGLVQPPLDKFLEFSQVQVLLEKDDLPGAKQALANGEELIEQFKLEDLRSLIDQLTGSILRHEGDHLGAAAAFQATRERIERSVSYGNDSFTQLSLVIAEQAESLVLGGDLEEAEKALGEGFRIDPSQPLLWLARARHQFASGRPELAQASIAYALAIWKDADPDYRRYQEALELEAEIRRSM